MSKRILVVDHLLTQVSNTPASRYYRGGSWDYLART